MAKVVQALMEYLKDWKNLLVHGVIGIGLIVIALFLPVHPLLRLVILVVVVAFNILRGKRDKARKAALLSSRSAPSRDPAPNPAPNPVP